MKDNDYQLALNYFIENIKTFNRNSDGTFYIPRWSKNRLQELVDKSKPTKPVFIDKEYGDKYLSCPHCHNSIVNVWNNRDYQPNYCHYCGQRLDWTRGDVE